MCDMVCVTHYILLWSNGDFLSHHVTLFCQACRTFGTFLLVHQTKVWKFLTVRCYLPDGTAMLKQRPTQTSQAKPSWHITNDDDATN